MKAQLFIRCVLIYDGRISNRNYFNIYWIIGICALPDVQTKSRMTKKEVTQLSKIILEKIEIDYGLSKHQPVYPYLEIEDSPYSDAEDPDLIGEYKNWDNEMVVYWKNIKTVEVLIRTLIHEYQHYLQSPTWMSRYWKMGYGYNDHPYEVAAYKEEENWEKYS